MSLKAKTKTEVFLVLIIDALMEWKGVRMLDDSEEPLTSFNQTTRLIFNQEKNMKKR